MGGIPTDWKTQVILKIRKILLCPGCWHLASRDVLLCTVRIVWEQIHYWFLEGSQLIQQLSLSSRTALQWSSRRMQVKSPSSDLNGFASLRDPYQLPRFVQNSKQQCRHMHLCIGTQRIWKKVCLKLPNVPNCTKILE